MKQTHEYVTTAIVYPNARIHVGWAWECLGADWLVRGLQALGKSTLLVTGMDEHSVKVQRTAESLGLAPEVYCDQMASEIQKVLKRMGIAYDRFIRTSDEDHRFVVKTLVERAFQSGDVYLSRYEGAYCEGCEAFYTEKDLVQGLCPSHQKAPAWISEENYFFRLSKYQEKLLQFFREHSNFLEPDFRQSEILHFIESGLKDFSISRSGTTWGIPLPFDPQHVIYVWFDALINYLTAAGLALHLKDPAHPEFLSCWPVRVHIIGKDIARFHCVYWLAMLMALDLPLPKKVFAHGFLTIKGERMSKSSGNVVSPDEVMDLVGVDPFRYYLLAENSFAQDGNFSWKGLILKNNADLAHDWGNLVNRSLSMTLKYFEGSGQKGFQKPEGNAHSESIQKAMEKLPQHLEEALNAIDPQAYATRCLEGTRLLNLYIDRTKPWALARDQARREQLHEVLFALLEGIRWLAYAWIPLMPESTSRVFDQLGISENRASGFLVHLKWGTEVFYPQTPSPIYSRLPLQDSE